MSACPIKALKGKDSRGSDVSVLLLPSVDLLPSAVNNLMPWRILSFSAFFFGPNKLPVQVSGKKWYVLSGKW